MTYARVFLKIGKDKPVRAFHPWIFSGAINSVDDFHQPGDLVRVHAHDQTFLGIGYLNPKSQIAIRMLSFRDGEIDAAFFRKRIQQAQDLRRSFLPAKTNGYRLVHAEGDFLPGLVIDRYDSYLVIQFQTLGMEKLKPLVLEALNGVEGIRGIYERGGSNVKDLEGLEKHSAVLQGEAPPDLLEIEEHGHHFNVDIRSGQKTGFFLDQRENRKLVGDLAFGKRVLNCFSYTGGFSVYAAKNGAVSVTSVDSAENAIDLSRKNFEKNNLAGEQYRFVCRDVFDYLREDQSEYDLVILDPPAFCKAKSQIEKAARGYKDINLFAMKRITPNGVLFTASCSSYIDQDLFQKIIFAAAKDVKREVQILKKTSHPPDHPVNIYHPEGEYLKGFLCRIL